MFPPTNQTSKSRCLSCTLTCLPAPNRRLSSCLRLGTTVTSGLLMSSINFPHRRSGRKRSREKMAATVYGRFGSPERRVTDTLIVLNVAMFGLQTLTGSLLLAYGAKINDMILKGQIWRFWTAAFLHGDLLHLGFNCNALLQIGPLVESVSGHARFATVYLGSAAAGSLLSFLMSPHMSIGASGAIFGTASALAMFAYRHRQLMGPAADELLVRLRDTAAINLMYGLVIRHIDNWGHLGGLLGGAVLSYLLGPALKAVVRNNKVVGIEDRPLIPLFATRTSRSSLNR